MRKSPIIIENNIPTVYQEIKRRKAEIVQYVTIIPLTIFLIIMSVVLTAALVKVTGLFEYLK